MLEHVLRTLEGATKRGGVRGSGRRWGASPSRRRSPGAWRFWHPTRRFVTGTTLLIDGGWMSAPASAEVSRHELLRRHRRHRRPGRRARGLLRRRCFASRRAPSTRGSISSREAADETQSLSAAVAAADDALPRGEGAAFIAVVPVWGVVESPHDAARRAGGRRRPVVRPCSIERWSRRGTADQRRRLRRARHGRDRPACVRAAELAAARRCTASRRVAELAERDRLPVVVRRRPTSPAACSTGGRRLDGVLLVLPRPRPVAPRKELPMTSRDRNSARQPRHVAGLGATAADLHRGGARRPAGLVAGDDAPGRRSRSGRCATRTTTRRSTTTC